MISTIGISNLQVVDMNSSRNLFIVGVSLFTGIVVPPWVSAHPDSIELGKWFHTFTVLTWRWQ